MAAGGQLLDADGKVRLQSNGRTHLSDGAGDNCCCGGPTSTCCVTLPYNCDWQSFCDGDYFAAGTYRIYYTGGAFYRGGGYEWSMAAEILTLGGTTYFNDSIDPASWSSQAACEAGNAGRYVDITLSSSSYIWMRIDDYPCDDNMPGSPETSFCIYPLVGGVLHSCSCGI
jgi:hypothetical protein